MIKNYEDLIKPIEHCLEGIRAAIIRDTAVDALCHGAPLAVPGVIAVPKDLKKGELVGIYTLKGRNNWTCRSSNDQRRNRT